MRPRIDATATKGETLVAKAVIPGWASEDGLRLWLVTGRRLAKLGADGCAPRREWRVASIRGVTLTNCVFECSITAESGWGGARRVIAPCSRSSSPPSSCECSSPHGG